MKDLLISNQVNLGDASLIDFKSFLQAEEVGKQYAEKEQQEFNTLTKELSEIKSGYRNDLIQSLGSENFEKLVKLKMNVIQERKEMVSASFIKEKEPDLSQLQTKKLQQLESIDIASSTLEKIGKNYGEKYLEIMKRYQTKPDSVLSQDNYQGTDQHKMMQKSNHNCTAHTPSYSGWQHGRYVDSDFGYEDLDHYTNSTTGFTGNKIYAKETNADDFDPIWIRMDSQIVFWHRTNGNGLLKLDILFQNIDAEHYLSRRDEWGRSNAYIFQDNFLMAHVIHPDVTGPATHRLSYQWWDGDSNGSWTKEYLVNNGYYRVTLYSNAPIPANTWVPIRVGTRSGLRGYTDDVSVWTSSTFKHIIKEVNVCTV